MRCGRLFSASFSGLAALKSSSGAVVGHLWQVAGGSLPSEMVRIFGTEKFGTKKCVFSARAGTRSFQNESRVPKKAKKRFKWSGSFRLAKILTNLNGLGCPEGSDPVQPTTAPTTAPAASLGAWRAIPDEVFPERVGLALVVRLASLPV